MLDRCVLSGVRVKEYDISFSVPVKKPKVGDRVACWTLAAASISQRGYLTRQGCIMSTIVGADDSVVAYEVKDEVSGESVFVGKDMLFVPGDGT